MNRPVVNLNSPKFDFDSKKHIANLNEHTNVIIKLQKFRTPYENIQKHKDISFFIFDIFIVAYFGINNKKW